MSTVLSRFAQDKAVKWICAGWGFFTLENLVLSHNREQIIDVVGDSTYHTVYSTLSTAACGSIAFGYLRHGPGVKIMPRGNMLGLAAAVACQTVGLVGLSQLAPKFQIPVTILTGPQVDGPVVDGPVGDSAREGAEKMNFQIRCPFDFSAPEQSASGDSVTGVRRVTRHPVLYSVGLFGLGLAIASPYPARMALFSGPLLVALVGTQHQDYRYRRQSGGSLTPEIEAKSSNLPFLALLSGRQDWVALSNETKWSNAGIATAAVAVALVSRGRAR